VRNVIRAEREIAAQDRLIESSQVDVTLFADWKKWRRCISWFDIARALSKFAQRIAGKPDQINLHCWAQGILSVLNFLGERPFEGFVKLLPMETVGHMIGSRVFWIGVGMRAFTWPDPVEIKYVSPVFFHGAIKTRDFHGRK
jgi:hypothetical protein